MIFAKVNVDLLTHQRVSLIPKRVRREALGLWLSALLYTRGKELDGFCPMHAIDLVPSDKVLQELVRVGLLSTDEQDGVHGVVVLRYAEFNETKAEILSRRRSDRARKAKSGPAPSQPGSAGIPSGIRLESERSPVGFPPQGIPGSDSDSGSGSPIGEGDPEGSTGVRAIERPPPMESGTVPVGAERYVAAGDRLEPMHEATAQMAGVQDIPGAWLKFCGHYAGKWHHVAGKWQLWCVNEAKRERTERDRERSRNPGPVLTAEGLHPDSFEASQNRKAREKKERAEFVKARLAIGFDTDRKAGT